VKAPASWEARSPGATRISTVYLPTSGCCLPQVHLELCFLLERDALRNERILWRRESSVRRRPSFQHIMSQKRKREADAAIPTKDESVIFRSEPITDRSSRFVAFFSPDTPPKTLQSLPEINQASHKILAWRKVANQRSLKVDEKQYTAGHDDDGEQHGGKKVEKVLEDMRVTGSCVVARWYGGILLGPVRFMHMEDCAREALQKWQQHQTEEQAKKRRLDAEAVESARLATALAERDKSITVLRELAAEKEKMVKDGIVQGVQELAGESERLEQASTNGTAEAGPQPAQKQEATPKPAMDYSTMPLERLRALDRARDATLSFLLKRIGKAEADLAALHEKPEDKPEDPP
jgi:putative IMPACT (imprinted ancient) family translation regulator